MIIFISLAIAAVTIFYIAMRPDDIVGWALWLIMVVGLVGVVALLGFICSSRASTNTTSYYGDRYDTTITNHNRYWYFDKDHKFTSKKTVLVYDRQAHKILEKGRMGE
ncbi:hypothetical protein FOL01_0441 [Weissella jogaejeotgali]|uniref:Uncharacterized protein n=1 Tax=Weissella jogaejeotgali TaxID=1631871 RepID=A0A1L6R9X6_9LACO|nr:hypothetical protein [Weissella jogaejeotgali]APS41300.1 hypothetical protein FOL01_0441 [Weissella jogaejeotgali]